MIFSFITGLIFYGFIIFLIVFACWSYWLIKHKSKLLYLFAVISSCVVFSIVKVTTTSNVIEINSDYSHDIYLAIGFPDFIAKTGKIVPLQLQVIGVVYVNSSETDLIVGPVYYGNADYPEKIFTLPSHGSVRHPHFGDYYPGQIPPDQITLSNQSSSTQYWITTEEIYDEFMNGNY